MPDFIGFILVLIGLVQLAAESKRFINLKPWTLGMIIYTTVLYIFDLTGLSVHMYQFITVISGLVSVAVSLYISYQTVLGIKDIEENKKAELNSGALMKTWLVTAVFQVLSAVAAVNHFLMIVSLLGSFVTAIIFLVQLNKSSALYENFTQLK